MMNQPNPKLWTLAFSLLVLGYCFISSTLGAMKDYKKYRPRNGVISLKGEVFGGEFRVTNVIPLRGDFSKYNRVEIVPLQSLIGNAVPQTIIQKYTSGVYSEFKKSYYFKQVYIIDSYERPVPKDPVDIKQSEDFRKADSLEAPMLTWEDLIANDKQRSLAAQRQRENSQDANALVVTGQIIDYVKGNKYLDLLPLDLGNAIISVRFSYFDKETGEELGRQVISSETGNKLVPMFLSVRNTVVGIVEGLVDQLTRRKAASER